MTGRVVVVGSVNMDVVARTAGLPAPGETVLGDDLAFHPGGKGANQAVAASRAGATTAMVGRLGDDPFGADLRRFLESAGVDTTRLLTVSGASGTALIAVDHGGENQIVVVPGVNGHLEPNDVMTIGVGPGDVVVSQLEIPVDTVAAALTAARRSGATTVLNAAPAHQRSRSLLSDVDVLVVNVPELAAIAPEVPPGGGADAPGQSRDAIERAAAVAAAHGCAVVVTLGAAGVVAVEPAGRHRVTGHRVDAVDATGAGDCFVGNLAARMAAGDGFGEALEVANAAAAVCATRPGAGPSMPALSETTAFQRRRSPDG